MEDLADLTAASLSDAYRSGSLSPTEVIGAVIARVERLEPILHATYAFDPDSARRSAAASERRWREATPFGPLDGVPVSVKENIATQGVPQPIGSAASDLAPAPVDAPTAARLREAGAVIFAKTTMPDFGMLSSGLSSFHALTRNPWDTRLNPGGSSAGAGAAAAAGYGPLHVGTDIGGSIRLPAAWCGVFGLKPSHGRIPIYPPYIGRTAGPMTRTVRDAALMMSVVTTPDSRDFMSLPPSDLQWLDLDLDVRSLRIGLMLEAGCGTRTHPEILAAVEEAGHIFADAGAIVEPLAPFMTPAMLDGFDQFFRTRYWVDSQKLPRERYEAILPYIREWAEGAEAFDSKTAYEGYSQLMTIRERGVAATLPYDFILSPVAPMVAYPAELPGPNNNAGRPFDHIGYTMPFNMTEQPASSINCGYTREGLPIGLQIVGRRFDDTGVLRASHWYEQARGKMRPWPQLVA